MVDDPLLHHDLRVLVVGVSEMITWASGSGPLAAFDEQIVTDNKASSRTDIGQITGQSEVVDHPAAELRVVQSALDTETEHAAKHARPEQLLRDVVRRVVGQPGVAHPRDLRVLLEVARDRERVLTVSLRAQRERLEALQEQERVEGRHAGAEVAEDLDTGFQNEREGPEGRGEGEAVVALGGLGEGREAGGVRPVELA